MFDVHRYAWMKAGNLLTSLASLSPEFLALARSVCPCRLLLPLVVSAVRDADSGIFFCSVCVIAMT